MATYYELVVRGDHKQVIPYLAGYIAGAGLTDVYFAHEAGLHLKPLRDRIKHHHEVQHVICTHESRAPLRDAVKNAAPRYDFEIVEECKLERGYFHFDYDTPSRDVGKQIKKIFASLPEGVTAMDHAPEEHEDKEAKGAEVYAPVHDYRLHGKGVIEGDVGGVIATRRTLGDIEFANCGEIDLHRASKD